MPNPIASDSEAPVIDLRSQPTDRWIAMLVDHQDAANVRQERLLEKLVDGMPNARLVHGAE